VLDERMEIREEIERLQLRLPARGDRRTDRADVVAEMRRAGRGDAGEYPLLVHGAFLAEISGRQMIREGACRAHLPGGKAPHGAFPSCHADARVTRCCAAWPPCRGTP